MTPYLKKNGLYPALIREAPAPGLEIVVVIPCYNETALIPSLLSLKKCIAGDFDTEVIVVINHAEDASDVVKRQNRLTYREALEWVNENSVPKLNFHILYKGNNPKKHAGVGLARKIGMDEAVWRLQIVENPGGVIACFDADSLCREDYLIALAQHFRDSPETQAAGIHFEHPLEGENFAAEVYDAILFYELHLRYFIHAQQYAGFPHAVQTIGSSMAVRCDAYQQQGGMNKRKAGEDFYFIHKFTAIGKHSEITGTVVYPSPRISDRVPFGTGKAVGEIISQPGNFQTYAPECFKDLKIFLEQVPVLYDLPVGEIKAFSQKLPAAIRHFLTTVDFENKLLEIQKNSSSPDRFQKRFYQWFTAFMLMKYVHYARDNYYPNVGIEEGTDWLFATVYKTSIKSLKKRLLFLRELSKSEN